MWRTHLAAPAQEPSSDEHIEAGVGSVEGVWEEVRELPGAGDADGGVRDRGAALWSGGAVVQRSVADQEASRAVAGSSRGSLRPGVGQAAVSACHGRVRVFGFEFADSRFQISR